jgi:uncharacterized protein YdeI (YjbR/CyaY-like superfamily)
LAELSPEQTRALKANAAAWKFYEAQPAGYKRVTKHWVTTARQEATRERRMAALIAASATGKRLPQFVSPPGKK